MGHPGVFDLSTPLARRLALDILRRTMDHGRDLQAAVDDVLAGAAAGPDKGLATELAYGYLRMRGRIDFILGQLLRNPQQTSPVLKRILGVAAYELLFLSRIPEYATLDWAVSLVRGRLDQTMGKVANGVLRNLVRLGRAVHLPAYYEGKTAGQAGFLSAWCSCPHWLAEAWIKAYGPDKARACLEASLQAPPQGVRINRLHPRSEDLRQALIPLATRQSGWGFALERWPDFLEAAASDGAVTRQSLAAQEIMDKIGVEHWPNPVLDACCGRGGKSFLMAEMGKDVWASDVNVFRLRQVKGEAERTGLNVSVFRAPAQGPYPLRPSPRTVFFDAPCSGLGVLARRPDIKWKRSPKDCAELALLQAEMLRAGAELLPPGGCLAYVTCTLNPAENEGQIDGFVRAHPGFRLLRQAQTDPGDGLGEFFYGAVLRKG
jgi:16S rRNA (cytosine967-C5)-methyltransferase